jgi:hypothetical protein
LRAHQFIKAIPIALCSYTLTKAQFMMFHFLL